MLKNRTRTLRAIVFFVLVSLMFGCGKKTEIDNRFLGSWILNIGKSHKIMTYKTSGIWSSEIRVEGALQKIVKKKAEVKGTWYVKEGHLVMIPGKSNKEFGWEKDKPFAFEVVSISDSQMRLKDLKGKVLTWNHVKTPKHSGKGNTTAAISLDPIVVNLKKDHPSDKSRYLCLKLDFSLNIPIEEGKPFKLPPRAKEAAIFHLSSLSYREVNTMDKVMNLRDSLFRVMRPYLKGSLTGVDIKGVVVTYRWEGVQSFLSQYRKDGIKGGGKKKK